MFPNTYNLHPVADHPGLVSDPFPGWLASLEERHRAQLTFQEVRRALQALSSLYVERRNKIGRGAALDGAGKRAAFALYYGPLHFLLVRNLVRALGAASAPLARLVDLGCGTGVAGAAWAVEAGGRAFVECVDANAWAVAEARWTLGRCGLRGHVSRRDLLGTPLPAGAAGVVAAFTVNELTDPQREELLPRLLAVGGTGARVLVVEPLARGVAPWWPEWSRAFVAAGGRQDEWRFKERLPESVAQLAHAAGLSPGELTGRTLYLGSAS